MSEIIQTRLRYVSSKDVNKILTYVNNLSYKIEIKGNPTFGKNQWFLWFIIPDSVGDIIKESLSGNLD